MRLPAQLLEKEYGVDQNFIERGIRGGQLEYRQGSVWGNPYLRLLRSQLEQYITHVGHLATTFEVVAAGLDGRHHHRSQHGHERASEEADTIEVDQSDV